MTQEEKELLSTSERLTNRHQTDFDEKELIETLEKENPIIVGFAFDWDYERKGVRVSFGKGLIGFISCDELTTKPLNFKPGKEMPNEAFYILNKNIIAEVVYFNVQRGEFMLSRKNSMIKSYDLLRDTPNVDGVIHNIDNSIFIDVGAGNLGRMPWREFSAASHENHNKIGFEVGDIIHCKVIGLENYYIELSRREAYDSYAIAKRRYKPGDEVVGMITAVFQSRYGDLTKYSYLVEIEPNVPGILNSEVPCKIGDVYEMEVMKVKEQGLKLKPKRKL